MLRTIAAIVIALVAAACATLPPTPQSTEDRFSALVVGISYQSAANENAHLENTLNDAQLIANSLNELKPRFKSVRSIFDPNRTELRDALNGYYNELDKNTTAVFYYAGHGVQIGGENYLLAEDMGGFIRMTDIISALRQRSKGVVIIFDACRNNPFETQLPTGSLTSARALPVVNLEQQQLTRQIELASVSIDEINNGLARVHVTGSRVMIVFATDPGGVAYDATYPGASNSPFSAAIAAFIGSKKSIEEVFNDVAAQLELRATGHEEAKQTPWRQSSWTEPVYLAGRPDRFESGDRGLIPPP